MKTVGEIIRDARESHGYSVEDLSQKTKIKEELIVALEQNDYPALPPAAYVQGFIKSISKSLGLEEDSLLALFRRDYRSRWETEDLPPSELDGSGLIEITPQRTSIIAGVFGVLLIGVYVAFNLLARPRLVITVPEDRSVVSEEQVTIVGETNPNATLLVNNQEVELRPQGKFAIDLTLQPGTNTVSVVSRPSFGRENRQTITVVYEPNETETGRKGKE